MGMDFRGLEMGIGKLVLQIEKFRVGPPGVLARDGGGCEIVGLLKPHANAPSRVSEK